jgi:hypothetical protein
VVRSTDFVTSEPPDADLVLVDPYNKCEHEYAILIRESFTTLGRRYGTYGQVNNNLFKFQWTYSTCTLDIFVENGQFL